MEHEVPCPVLRVVLSDSHYSAPVGMPHAGRLPASRLALVIARVLEQISAAVQYV